MEQPRHFRAVLEPDATALKWTIARVPFDVTKAWPVMKRPRVRGTINGAPFRTSLFPDAHHPGGRVLLVNKMMQKMAGVLVGGAAEFTLEPDLDERTPSMPPELAALLRKERPLQRWFRDLSESMRQELGKYIEAAGTPVSRQVRAEETVERMLSAMEGEREMPPVLDVAFRRRPRARAGWENMTDVQRRGHLLGIFYYKSPESRMKRAEKAVDEAAKRVAP
jgi:uncharacterized protein YdeI (YjbR/CyaY-like superfamily)